MWQPYLEGHLSPVEALRTLGSQEEETGWITAGTMRFKSPDHVRMQKRLQRKASCKVATMEVGCVCLAELFRCRLSETSPQQDQELWASKERQDVAMS